MGRQQGNLAVTLAAVLIVGGASGAFIYHQTQQLQRMQGELAAAQASLQQTKASAEKARTEAAAARKELDEQKGAIELLRAERDSARNLLEAERSHNDRIRAELTLAQQQLASIRSRGGAAPQYPVGLAPQPVYRVAPASARPMAIGAGVPAQVQGQTASPGYRSGN